MSSINAAIKSHPVPTYFALAFAISWGGLLVVGPPDGTSGTTWQSDPRLPFLVLAMLAGPSVAGLLLTGVVSGRAGLRELLSRLLRWRIGARWYAVALLTAPLVFMAVHFSLSLISPVFLPGILTASLLLPGIAGALVVGFFEELGWTGFAIPRLRLRYGVLATGLIVGLPWGAWHLLTNDIWIGSTHSGGLPLALFLTVNGFSLLLGQLTAYRVLMVWVYDRTGSLLVAMLMHASLSACTFILGPSATGLTFLTYVLVLAAAWWIVVVVVAAANGGQVPRPPFYLGALPVTAACVDISVRGSSTIRVAETFIPFLRSLTDAGLPSTVNLNDSGTL
jgi:uncharacterized protein